LGELTSSARIISPNDAETIMSRIAGSMSLIIEDSV